MTGRSAPPTAWPARSIQNMVTGVSQGFQKDLQIEGVGYRAEMKGADLVLSVGFSHPVTVNPPAGISFTVDEKARTIQVKGFDREQVGQVAADIRGIRPAGAVQGKRTAVRRRARPPQGGQGRQSGGREIISRDSYESEIA